MTRYIRSFLLALTFAGIVLLLSCSSDDADGADDDGQANDDDSAAIDDRHIRVILFAATQPGAHDH